MYNDDKFFFLPYVRPDRGRQGGFSASIWCGCHLMNKFIYVDPATFIWPKVKLLLVVTRQLRLTCYLSEALSCMRSLYDYFCNWTSTHKYGGNQNTWPDNVSCSVIFYRRNGVGTTIQVLRN